MMMWDGVAGMQHRLGVRRREIAISLSFLLCSTHDRVSGRDVMAALGLRPDMFNAVHKTDLADLALVIGSPTCRPVEAECGMCACSRCGAEAWPDRESVTNYCPECGAEVLA